MVLAFLPVVSFGPISRCAHETFVLRSVWRSGPRALSTQHRRPRRAAVYCVEKDAPSSAKIETKSATTSRKPWHIIPFLRPKNESPEAGTQRAARGLWRVGWLTWWVQLVLTTISAVILLFAFAFPGVSVQSSASTLGLVFTGFSVVLAIVSLFWTYSYTRFSMRLASGDSETSRSTLKQLATFLYIGSGLTSVGLVLALLGLQATVGTLLARLFTASAAPKIATQAGTAALLNPSPVQAIDILVVQATANAMSSLFTALLSTIWLQGRLQKWQLSAETVKNGN